MDAWILATLLVCFLGNSVGALEPKAPVSSCPDYLPEGEDLDCQCHSTSPGNSCKTYWLGRTAGPRLQKSHVTRDDNGMRFTCEMDCSGQKSSTDYALQVAYGPSEGSVSVQGPPSILADGVRTMTLTCVPGEVNPAPSFKWTSSAGLLCMNGDKENTCVLRPKHFHDGKRVSCSVSNEQTATYITAGFTLHLIYPPPKTPELAGYTRGTPLKPGDTLQCTVKGGNPPVSTVYLNCSDLNLHCQHRTTGASRVTSCQLDFKENKGDTEEIQCSCSAVWGPDPQLYVHVATDTIKVGSASEPKAPVSSCPDYLPEGEDLDCQCHSTSSDNSCKTYWLGRTAGPRLQKSHVTRDDNGMRFNCEMDCSGQKSSTDYALQVAYGPSEGSVSVQGPPSILADGDHTMTLTCVPGEMNPAPSFKWTSSAGLLCMNGDKENTCVLRPRPFHDGKRVSCSVSNEQTATYITAGLTLHLIYPPPKTPELAGYTRGTPLKPGDTLQCTVKGGKPPVSTVYLNCSDLTLHCQRRTTGDSRVTSCQLDFKENKGDTEGIQCSCSAVWGPDPQLYVHMATDTIKVGIPPAAGGHGRQGPQTEAGTGAGTGSTGLIIGVILAGLLVIAIPVVVFVIWRRKRRPQYDEHDVECQLNNVALLPLSSSIGEDDTSRDTTQPEDVETDCGCSTLPGYRESIPLSSAKSVSERDVEEPVGMSGDYSTVLEETKGRVKTPVKVLAQNTSIGYTEVQLAEPELPVLTVSPHDVLNISQLDLPKPEVCLSASHFASSRIIQSTPKYRGPLRDKYTLVVKKKGRCVAMVPEDSNRELADTVEPAQNFKTEAVKMKNPEAEDCDDGTQGKLH